MQSINSSDFSGRLLLTKQDLCQLTGCVMSTIDNWIKDGIPCFREEKVIYFEKHTVIDWLCERALSRHGVNSWNYPNF